MKCEIYNHPRLIPGHSMYGDAAFEGFEYSYVSIKSLLTSPVTPKPKLAKIQLTDVWSKPGDWFGIDDFDPESIRYQKADPSYPGIVVEGMQNPAGKPFRLIDGRRRLNKLKTLGVVEYPFYIFPLEAVRPFIVEAKMRKIRLDNKPYELHRLPQAALELIVEIQELDRALIGNDEKEKKILQARRKSCCNDLIKLLPV